MPNFLSPISPELALILIVTAVMLYVSSRTIAQAIGGTTGRAVGHFLPIIFTALVATWAGLYSLAINVLFSSTVMIVTMVIGVALISAPMGPVVKGQRAWALLLPIAAIAWMAGFAGTIDFRFAAALAAAGALIAWVADGEPHLPHEPRMARTSRRALFIGLSIPIAIMGAIAAVIATQRILLDYRTITQGMVASAIVAPLLVLPLLGATSDFAITHNTSGRAVALSMTTALLNLCVGLPAIMLLRIAREYRSGTLVDKAFPIPYGTWRFDALLLVIAGLLLAPIGLGRWLPTRLEGLLLVMMYVVYLYIVSPLNAS